MTLPRRELPRDLLLGVLHLPPLPGSPLATPGALDEAIHKAQTDAATLLAAGFDGFVLENYGDVPFFRGSVPAYVLTCMTRIACEIPRDGAFLVLNVLRNDAIGALSIAAAVGADAVRINVHSGAMVTDQGVIEGCAAETVRLRSAIASDVLILADVHVKHASPLAATETIEDAARDAAYRGLADALIVTGQATGKGASRDDIERVRHAVPDRPILVGSGVTIETAAEWRRLASGVIVGSALEPQGAGGPIDPTCARDFAQAWRGAASDAKIAP